MKHVQYKHEVTISLQSPSMFLCKVCTLLSLGMVTWAIMWPIFHIRILISRLEDRMVELEVMIMELNEMEVLVDQETKNLEKMASLKRKLSLLINNKIYQKSIKNIAR